MGVLLSMGSFVLLLLPTAQAELSPSVSRVFLYFCGPSLPRFKPWQPRAGVPEMILMGALS